MSTKILAIIEIDADGSIHVTSGPAIHPALGTPPGWAVLPAAPSWTTSPNRREVTLASDTVRTRVVWRTMQDERGAPNTTHYHPDSERALAFVSGLRWLAGEGERP